MTTVKQIERLWTARKYDQLFRELIPARPEASVRLEVECSHAVPAAAMAMVRLDELGQAQAPLYAKLRRTLVATQECDGGWGDPMATALALRALLNGRDHKDAIDRGLFYLAQMQKPEGIWPKVPFRRMPADPYVSAFVLFELGENDRFRRSVRFLDAVNWFESHEGYLDDESRRLWDRASLRCQIHHQDGPAPLLWS
jgi:hypothetical protein